jgi:hypothetical protein
MTDRVAGGEGQPRKCRRNAAVRGGIYGEY